MEIDNRQKWNFKINFDNMILYADIYKVILAGGREGAGDSPQPIVSEAVSLPQMKQTLWRADVNQTRGARCVRRKGLDQERREGVGEWLELCLLFLSVDHSCEMYSGQDWSPLPSPLAPCLRIWQVLGPGLPDPLLPSEVKPMVHLENWCRVLRWYPWYTWRVSVGSSGDTRGTPGESV